MLHLAHHKHTGKILPHHHTSYRGLFLLLLVTGVALASIQSVAHAGFLDVAAKISGPLPTTAAVITAPLEGTHYVNSSAYIQGTCQDMSPPTIVIIYSDDQNLGSGVCASGGTFYIPVTLIAGTHTLIAQTSNSTDDLGPDSSPVHVTYTPPTPPTPAPTPSSPAGTTGTAQSTTPSGNTKRPASGSCISPQTLRVVSTASYLDYGRLAAANWEFSVVGGCAPYRVSIDWGDNIIDIITVRDNDLLTARHAYAKLKPSYPVNLKVVSADKQTASFTTVSVTPYIPPTLAGGLVEVDTPFILTFQGSLLRAYLAYLAALLIFGVAWYDSHIRRVRLVGVHVFPTPPRKREKY